MIEQSAERTRDKKIYHNHFSRVSLWFSILYISLFNLVGFLTGLLLILLFSLASITIDFESNDPLVMYALLLINASAILTMGIITYFLNKKTLHIKSQMQKQKLVKDDWKIFIIAFIVMVTLIGSYQLFLNYMQNNILSEVSFENPYDFFNSDKLGVLVFATFIVTFLAPITEELFYRWALISILRQGFRKSSTILFSAMIFSLAHSLTDLTYSFSYFVVHLIATFMIGVILGYVFYQTKKVILTILLHGLWNFMIASSVFFEFGDISNVFNFIFIAIVCISAIILAGLIFYYYIMRKKKKVEIVKNTFRAFITEKIHFYGSWFELVLLYFILAGLIPSILGIVSFGSFMEEGILQIFYFGFMMIICIIILHYLLRKHEYIINETENQFV